MDTPWNWPGSRWWRVDLHTHSAASYDFNDEEEKTNPDWSRWITAVREAGIEAVAITDHNTAAAVEHLQRAISDLEDAPVLFPGVELTSSGGTHLLILTDPGREQEHVEDLLSRVGVAVDQRGEQTSRSSLSIEEILDVCEGEALVVGAHINAPCGLLELRGQDRLAVLRHKGLAAVGVDPSREMDSRWLDASKPEIWRRLSQVRSSDGHSFDELGRRFTWVKMTRPDLEGLRLALLDGATSLQPSDHDTTHDPNSHSDLALESLTVHNSKFIGRTSPLEIAVSPWLNAIIGSRGTGKSTLIDLCRMTLGRASKLDGRDGGEEGALRRFFDRRMSVARSRAEDGLLLEDTHIAVTYRKDGERFVLSWSTNGGTTRIAHVDGADQTVEEGDVRERFPVRIYSQKQLFALAQDASALLTVVDDSPNVRGAELRRSLEDKETRYLSLCAQARAAQSRASDLPARRAALTDVERKLAILQETGNTQVLNEYRRRRSQNDIWGAILSAVERSIDQVQRTADEVAVTDLDRDEDNDGGEADESFGRAHAALTLTVEILQGAVNDAVQQARRSIEEMQGGPDVRRWQDEMDAIERAFLGVQERLAAQGLSDQNEYAHLLGQASTLQRRIEDLNVEATRAAALENEAVTVLDEYRRRRTELTTRRRSFVQETSSELTRVRIDENANTANLAEELNRMLGIPRFEEDRREIAQRIRPEQSQAWRWENLDRVVAEMRDLASGRRESWDARDHRFETALRRVSPESVDRLALYTPEDSVEVSFKDNRDGEWRALIQGSPGQQTAALLAFVLGYGTEPIILDQPEDDLDSTLIYELLVARLRETKLKRQVIVVTHNPNTVVHGDAELVVSLAAASSASRIACAGGLQEDKVRDEICRVMEGGREAFETRYQRIMPSSILRA